MDAEDGTENGSVMEEITLSLSDSELCVCMQLPKAIYQHETLLVSMFPYRKGYYLFVNNLVYK